jgi:O-antigen ligase
MALSILIYTILVLRHVDKWGFVNFIIMVVTVSVASYFILPVFEEAFEIAIQGGFDDLDQFSSSRITLYKHALEIFKDYPLFGGGWEAMTDIGNPDRIQVFHSTIFHTLAVMGSFGLIALGYYFFISFKYLLSNRTLIKTLMFVGILISQIHGLYDNTMFMLIYTLATIFIFVLLENELEKADGN